MTAIKVSRAFEVVTWIAAVPSRSLQRTSSDVHAVLVYRRASRGVLHRRLQGSGRIDFERLDREGRGRAAGGAAIARAANADRAQRSRCGPIARRSTLLVRNAA
jgi:hypothetical protein